ncbi:MAG: 3'-5' exonuclease domain-containing protein 2 [Spartobacteria bacterium]|nr:3'-5' exonuclease domain-containing protein 2 [Spartobacteria bacterium]
MQENRERAGFDRRMTREEINQLEIERYDGPVCVIKHSKDIKPAIKALREEHLLGFDTETRPCFRKGQSFQPSLIQLAGKEMVYLFQISQTGLPRELCALLANPDIIKAGAAPVQDLNPLRQMREFEPAGFVDIGEMARTLGIKNHGLRGLAAVLLGFRISKQSQVSNWAKKDLTTAQVKYAAMDAWVSRTIYLHLQDIEENGIKPVQEATALEA